MQQLIIIRGHSGSGKSTFARQQISQFQQEFSNARIFHVENDKYLYQNGIYHWTEERFRQAKHKAKRYLQYAFQWCVKNPTSNALIVVSNVGINVMEIQRQLQQATELGLQTSVYRMISFYQNQHNVTDETAKSMFHALNANPIEGEILWGNGRAKT